LDQKYHVVVERTWKGLEIIECSNREMLRDCVLQLRTEISEAQKTRANHDLRIHIFRGSRMYLQKWPHLAVTDGVENIPIAVPGAIPPDIDASGSLCDTVNLATRPLAAPQDEVASVTVAPLPPLASAATPIDEDEYDAIDPSDDPQIV
jgi:hypothetical protein